ncbi:MAG: hypothetical protein JXR81_10775 [Candidatus Goldbacteria bacterium]|nr:hypothetical protein [Candidatus Goldiibacteriota bacterium]
METPLKRIINMPAYKKAVIFILFFFTVSFLAAGDNPFDRPVKRTAGEKSFVSGKFLKKTIIWQARLNREIAAKIDNYKKTGKSGVLAVLMAALFLYGAVHALGPGHGKTVISSWMASSRKKYSTVVFVSVFSAVVHALSAVLMVVLFFIILKGVLKDSESAVKDALQFASGALIFIIGIIMAFKVFRSEKGAENKKNTGHPLALALAVGLVPCPSTSIILIFSFSFGLYLQGLLFTMCFAAGMALTQFLIATGVWHIREKAESAPGKIKTVLTSKIFPAGAAVILCLSGGMIMLPYIYR